MIISKDWRPVQISVCRFFIGFCEILLSFAAKQPISFMINGRYPNGIMVSAPHGVYR